MFLFKITITLCAGWNTLFRDVIMPFGAHQDSILGLFLFSNNLKPKANIIIHYNLQHHQFAGDTQLYKALYINHLNFIIQTK